MSIRSSNPAPQRQNGVILIVVVIFMLLFGAMALQAFQSSYVTEKISGNQWEQDRALQAAEAGLVDARRWINSKSEIYPPDGSSDGSTGIWTVGSMSENVVDATYDWADAREFGENTTTTDDVLSDSLQPPAYIVENVGWARDTASMEDTSAGFVTFYYSVSAIGYGQGGVDVANVGEVDVARSVVQVVHGKRYR